MCPIFVKEVLISTTCISAVDFCQTGTENIRRYLFYLLSAGTSYCNLGNHVRRRIHKLMTKFMLQVDVKIVQSYDTFKAISSNKEIFIDSICSKCCLRLLFMQRKFLFMKLLWRRKKTFFGKHFFPFFELISDSLTNIHGVYLCLIFEMSIWEFT